MKQRTEKREKLPRVPFRLMRERLSRSIFAKYFVACVLVMLLSFAILASSLTVLSVRYSNSQKHELFEQNAQRIAQFTQEVSADGTEGNRQLSNLVQLFSLTIDADIYIVQPDGSILIGQIDADDQKDIASGQTKIPSSVMKLVSSSQEYFETSGKLDGFYRRDYLTTGIPIKSDSGTVMGAVFISSRADSMLKFMSDILRIFVICVVIVLLFTFAALYYLTQRMVRPLRQMAAAARSFAEGDFDKRVPVSGPDEIGQLAVAFNNMASSLVSLEEMRRSFVANVSHELRTPMTSISGFIDGILDGTIPTEKHEYYLNIVSDEVKRLSRMVSSLLNIARIEAGQVRIQQKRFDVAETIRRVVIGLENPIDEKHLDMRGLDALADTRLMVMADPDVTHQILFNLVENAVKFSNDGGYLSITTASSGKKVFVSVRNSGIGIPAADLPYVFERFYKTDRSRSTDHKGVGLGLYIVRSMLRLQGQDITVKSEEGRYCEFVFTLEKA